MKRKRESISSRQHSVVWNHFSLTLFFPSNPFLYLHGIIFIIKCILTAEMRQSAIWSSEDFVCCDNSISSGNYLERNKLCFHAVACAFMHTVFVYQHKIYCNMFNKDSIKLFCKHEHLLLLVNLYYCRFLQKLGRIYFHSGGFFLDKDAIF